MRWLAEGEIVGTVCPTCAEIHTVGDADRHLFLVGIRREEVRKKCPLCKTTYDQMPEVYRLGRAQLQVGRALIPMIEDAARRQGEDQEADLIVDDEDGKKKT